MRQRSSVIKIAVAALLVVSSAAETFSPAAAGVNWSHDCTEETSGAAVFYGTSAD